MREEPQQQHQLDSITNFIGRKKKGKVVILSPNRGDIFKKINALRCNTEKCVSVLEGKGEGDVLPYESLERGFCSAQLTCSAT